MHGMAQHRLAPGPAAVALNTAGGAHPDVLADTTWFRGPDGGWFRENVRVPKAQDPVPGSRTRGTVSAESHNMAAENKWPWFRSSDGSWFRGDARTEPGYAGVSGPWFKDDDGCWIKGDEPGAAVTHEELMACFDRIDRNGDGVIDRAEWMRSKSAGLLHRTLPQPPPQALLRDVHSPPEAAPPSILHKPAAPTTVVAPDEPSWRSSNPKVDAPGAKPKVSTPEDTREADSVSVEPTPQPEPTEVLARELAHGLNDLDPLAHKLAQV